MVSETYVLTCQPTLPLSLSSTGPVPLFSHKRPGQTEPCAAASARLYRAPTFWCPCWSVHAHHPLPWRRAPSPSTCEPTLSRARALCRHSCGMHPCTPPVSRSWLHPRACVRRPAPARPPLGLASQSRDSHPPTWPMTVRFLSRICSPSARAQHPTFETATYVPFVPVATATSAASPSLPCRRHQGE
jgi:hypothetical protein